MENHGALRAIVSRGRLDGRATGCGRFLFANSGRRHCGAQQILQQAIEAEVQDFLHHHQDRRDANGNRLVVRNGHQSARTIVTGAGALEVRQPRVRDNSPALGQIQERRRHSLRNL
jgi:transposase-like protein